MSYHSSLSGVHDGSGTALDPFGGIGGASEDDLAKLVAGGLKFFNPPNAKDKYQVGAINREKYIYVVGSDKMFYKFKYPNSGIGNTPSDSATQAWFDSVVAKNTKPVATTTMVTTSNKSSTGIKAPAITKIKPISIPTGLVNVKLPSDSSMVPATTSALVKYGPWVAGVAVVALGVRAIRKKKASQ